MPFVVRIVSRNLFDLKRFFFILAKYREVILTNRNEKINNYS